MDMVLFNGDYSKVSCIIDTKTKNHSFIRMSILLKKMGVVNNKFMLVLTQPELQGVDPLSDNLTERQRMMIAMECKINPWYAFRECIRIPAQGGEPVRFILNRSNLALMWCFFNNIDTFLTMPRQIGKTMASLALTVYSMYILGDHVDIGMFAKDSKLQVQNVRRVKEIRDALPSYLVKKGRSFTSDNQESIEYKPNTTKYISYVSCASRKLAESQGRGGSFIWTHWDEFAYYENNDLSYPSAIATTETAGEGAREAGMPCAHIITTTAGYTASGPGKFAFSFKNRAMRFEEGIYDCEDHKTLIKVLETNSTNNFMYLEFSYQQLGKDEKWFKRVCVNKDRETIERDYLNHWIHSSGDSIIPKHIMDALEANITEPVSITIENSIVMRWFAAQQTLDIPDIKNIPYIIGCDSADNVGKDFTTLVIINPIDMGVVMSCRCNQSNLVYFADTVLALLRRFPRSLFIPERNRAATLIDIILERMMRENTDDPFKRIFNYFVQDGGDQRGTIKHDISLGSVRKQFGYKTTGGADSRSLLFGKVLMTTVEHNNTKIYDKVLVDEMCGLVTRNGRIDHKQSGNDDTLIAYLIASWFIMYGKNIEMYGIDPREVLATTADGDFKDHPGMDELISRVEYLEQKLNSGAVSIMMRNAFECELAEIKPIVESQRGDSSTDKISMHQTNASKTPTNTFNMEKMTQGISMFTF